MPIFMLSSQSAQLTQNLLHIYPTSTIRRVLVGILHPNVRLTDETLNTVFCEVENIVNSRPITKLSDDIADSDPLTPNHLLIMNANFSFPWTVVHDDASYRKTWIHVQSLVHNFRNR